MECVEKFENISENVWDKKNSLWDYTKGLFEESKKNLKPEAWCISFCTAGEIAGATLSYYVGKAMDSDFGQIFINHSNEFGVPFALAAGSVYVFNHVKKDAERHGVKPSKKEVFYWAGTTEAACILTAVGIEYGAMKTFGDTSLSPLEIKNLLIETGAWISAYPFATVAMSLFTFEKKNEAGRIIAEKGSLEKLTEELKFKQDYTTSYPEDGMIGIYGDNSQIIIKEEELPEMYHKDYLQDENSIYKISSPGSKYSGDVRKGLQGIVCSAFNSADIPHKHVENPFAHDHSSHDHKH